MNQRCETSPDGSAEWDIPANWDFWSRADPAAAEVHLRGVQQGSRVVMIDEDVVFVRGRRRAVVRLGRVWTQACRWRIAIGPRPFAPLPER